MRCPLALASLVVPLGLALAGCGGAAGGGASGGNQAPGTPVTVVLGGDSALDGSVSSDGTATAFGGGPVTGDVDLAVADGAVARQFFAFTLAGVPAGATVTSASLRLHQRLVTGTPFATLGAVLLEHLDYGSALDGTDYARAPLEPLSVLVSSDPAVGLRTMDVSAFVQADVSAGRGRSEFRLRFTAETTDHDGANDAVHFVDAENSSTGDGSIPRLTVTFVP